MKIFVTGANGYIGGSVALALITDGHKVRGLVRSKEKADAVAAHGRDIAAHCGTGKRTVQ